MTVWLLETGEYSDYRVVGVYSTRAHATRVAEMLGIEDTAREVAVDAEMGHVFDGLALYALSIDGDGRIQNRSGYLGYETPAQVPLSGCWQITTSANHGVRLEGVAWARSYDHAVKNMSDKRRALMACGAWDDPALALQPFGWNDAINTPIITR